MMIDFISCGSYNTNCYIIRDEFSGEAAAIDCAVFNEDYKAFLERLNITKLKYILLTHGHFDHICGVKKLKDTFGGEVLMHSLDAPALYDEEKSFNSEVHFALQEPMKADRLLQDGDKIILGKTEISVLHTPGHTIGSVCYITENAVFSGDTLFYMSMGNVSFPGGNIINMTHSLKKLYNLPFDAAVFPGHGEKTTLSFERKNNPYMAAFRK